MELLKSSTPPASTPTTSSAATTLASHGSFDSLLSHSCSSSPRTTMEVLSDPDQCSSRSDPDHDHHDLRRVKFMCSYGGRIMPRPHDSQLRYVGGETRLLAVSRHISFADLMAKLRAMCGKNVSLKFQLPNEELDSLVSVVCDEDVENMMEEYDRNMERSRDGSALKLRLFLFPAKTQSASLADFQYECNEFSRNAEQRFVDAVNGLSRRQNSMPVGTSSQGLPDFLFGFDHVLDSKKDRNLRKTNSTQTLPRRRSSYETPGEFMINSEHQWPPSPHDSQHIHLEQPSLLLDPSIPASSSVLAMHGVANHQSVEDLELIKQLASLISAASDHLEPPNSKAVDHTTLQNSVTRKPEVNLTPSLDRINPQGPRSPTALEEKQQQQRKDHTLPVNITRSDQLKISPVKLPAHIAEETANIQPHDQLQTSPGRASSQYFASAIASMLRGAGSTGSSQREYDPQISTVFRHISVAFPEHTAQQQTRVDQTVLPRKPIRVQSPSRFRGMPPLTPLQVHCLNSSEEKMMLMQAPALVQQQPAANEGPGRATIQLPMPAHCDHYVYTNGFISYDPAPDLVANPPYDLPQFNQTRDTMAYPGAEGVSLQDYRHRHHPRKATDP